MSLERSVLERYAAQLDDAIESKLKALVVTTTERGAGYVQGMQEAARMLEATYSAANSEKRTPENRS